MAEESAPTKPAGGSTAKNVIAVALMVAVVAASGYYIYGRYQQHLENQRKVDEVGRGVTEQQIMEGKASFQKQKDTAKKFLPLLGAAQKKKDADAAAKDGDKPSADPATTEKPADAPAK